MAEKEYISREALKQKKVYSEERHEYIVPVAEIDWMPAADVVPRAEVDLYRRLNEELEDELSETYNKLETTEAKIEKIFAELDKEYGENCGAYRIDDVTDGEIWNFLAELKMKYTGEQK